VVLLSISFNQFQPEISVAQSREEKRRGNSVPKYEWQVKWNQGHHYKDHNKVFINLQ
jgi:hypothetical protein